jgi:magnesium transporter
VGGHHRRADDARRHYGMNFEYMPELEWTSGYPLAVATMVVIDAYLYVRFKKSRWL